MWIIWNLLESKTQVIPFTQDPLLPLQFLTATVETFVIIDVGNLMDNFESEEDLIILSEEKYYCLLSFCFDGGDLGTAMEKNDEILRL